MVEHACGLLATRVFDKAEIYTLENRGGNFHDNNKNNLHFLEIHPSLHCLSFFPMEFFLDLKSVCCIF